MELVANWAARPVFITSTFQDMQAERDWLWDFVFPAIEDRLRRRRRHLEWIDLRLGAGDAQAETEAEREAQVLKICLDEVRRSRPFLIALIGDRYGWVPPRDRAEAAAREAGITGDVAGCSVTEIEIDFGVFRDPEERRRSLFFLRDPLPYDTMGEDAARYADAYGPASDEGAPDRVARLDKLKDRIRRECPDHVHTYPAAWGEAAGRVTGLEAFGRRVEEALWQQLEAELAAEAEPTDLPWQVQEARALEAFAADRRRDFQGRTALLDEIAVLLHAPAQDGAPWALCLTGPPGAGKSAVFGELLRRLETTPALVLAHAAGASPRAPSVDAMLRRWIGELAAFLNGPAELAENADTETVERSFASLLGRTALRRRVLVLVDALDQFEQTPRGRFLTWLPALWPANARLFATAIPREASAALAARAGVEIRTMPALTEAETRAVFAAIHLRYHRTPDPAVLEALLKKEQAGWSNPLWLHLAVEQVNLLDEDDVARAEQQDDPTRSMAQRLRALLLSRVASFPTEVPGLYRFVFDHAARRFPALAPSFLGLLAVAAAGWRESDLRAVLPGLSGESWNDLRFAYLRRLFRGQLRPRGALEQWDVAHTQMRAAIRAWLPDHQIAETDLHAAVACHLLNLPADDPLRATDTMRHLLGARQLSQAASHYADSSLSTEAAAGATRFVAEAWLADETDPPVRADLAAMLALADLPDIVVRLLANRLVFDLYDAVAAAGLLSPRQDLQELIHPTLVRSAAADPNNADWQRYLSVSHSNMGDMLLEQGDLTTALEAYRAAHTILQRLAAADPNNADWQRGLFFSYTNIGDVLRNQGDLTRALEAFRAGLAIRQRLTAADPWNVSSQRDLSVSHERMGGVLEARSDLAGALEAYRASLAIRQRLALADPGNAGWQRDLSVAHNKMGDVRCAQGDLAGALAAHRASLAICQRLVAADPGNVNSQCDLSFAHNKMGDVLVAQGDLTGALAAYSTSLTIRHRLTAADPGNATWQRDLSASHDRMGDVLVAQGGLTGALAAYRTSLTIRTRLVAADPSNADWQRDLSLAHDKMGDVLVAQGDLTGALAAYSTSLTIRQRVAAADPGNAGWQHALSVSGLKMGDVLVAQGDLTEALGAYRAAHGILQRLTAADASNASWQRDLSVSHDRMGEVLVARGDLEGALEAYRASLAIRQRLAAADPSNAGWQRDLSLSHDNVGNVLARGDLPGALEAYRASLAIRQRLTVADPGNAGWQRDLSISHSNVGDVLMAQGDSTLALAAYRATHTILERLAAADPGNAGWQRDLSLSQRKIGNVLVDQGDRTGALDAYRASLGITQRLAALDPGNLGWQLDLSLSQRKIGDMLVDRDVARALEAYSASLSISQRVAALDPGNLGWQRDLSISLNRLGDVLANKGDLTGALEAYRAGMSIRQRLAAADPGNARWQTDLSMGHGSLGEVLRAQGDMAGALAEYSGALSIAERLETANPSNVELQRFLKVLHGRLRDVLSAMKGRGGMHLDPQPAKARTQPSEQVATQIGAPARGAPTLPPSDGSVAPVPPVSGSGANSGQPRLAGSPPPWAGTPRNAPCLCGSGKRFKHCHGRV